MIFRGFLPVFLLAWSALPAFAAPGRPDASTPGLQSGSTAGAGLEWLNLTLPALAEVRVSAERGEVAVASARLLEQCRRRLVKSVTPQPLTPAERLAAELALDNRLTAFGRAEPYDLGTPIDWTRNPTTNLEFLYFVNRHAMVKALADAYASTGEERYAAHAIDMMLGWVRTVPPTKKVAWRELEVALRCQVWAAALKPLVHSPSMTPEALGTLLASMSAQVETLLSPENWSEGNHGVNTSWGMMYVGIEWPELARAQTFATLGWERLNRHMSREVFDDGAQFELTSGYHAWCITRFHDALEWATAGKLPINPAYPKKLEKMYDYVLVMLRPDGAMPILGDSEMRNGREVMRRGGAQFKRPDMQWLGSSGREGSPPVRLDYALEDSGYYAMRTSWTEPNAVFAMLDVAHKWGGWHSHYDALELHLYGFGRNLLPESGTINYSPGPRAKSRATRSKSTVTIDGKDQSEAPARTHAFISTPEVSYVDGSQDGYPGVTHRRQLYFVRGEPGAKVPYIVVIDRISGAGSHTARQFFHLPPGDVISDTTGVRTAFGAGGNLEIRSFSTPAGALSVENTWIAPSGGSSQSGIQLPRKAAVTTYTGPLPATFVTFLLPFGGPNPPAVDTRCIMAESAPYGVERLEVRGLEGGWTDTIVCGEEGGIHRNVGVREAFRVVLVPRPAREAKRPE